MRYIKLKKSIGCALLAVLLLLMFLFDGISRFELQAQDALYRDLGVVNPDIIVFGIDEKTLDAFGPFQFWPRQIMADAITRLNADEDWKPAVIAVDVLYAGLSDDPAADAALVKAAKDGGNVVFGAMASYNWDGGVKMFEKPFDALRAVSRYGALNTVLDPGGVVRRTEMGIAFNGLVEPTFPETIYSLYTGGDFVVPEGIGNPLHIAYTGRAGDYYGAIGLGTSFCDIFADDFDPAFYADGIVFIGPYASGLMDSYFTPADSMNPMHGVEIHANIVQMMLDGNLKGYAPFWFNLTIVLSTLLLFGAVTVCFGDRVSLAVFIAVSAGWVYVNERMFGGGTVAVLIYPPVSAAVLFAYSVVYNYITAWIEKRTIKDMFRKYVDPKLVDELIKSNAAQAGAMLKKHFAVLFVDIRGFTPMSEGLRDEPETVVHILNDYLELTASCVFNNGGSVDKFIGDATMALFNGFTPLEDYTFKAVKTAFDIVQGAEELNRRIKEKYGEDVGFGVGVHCGYAVVGNIGPQFRKDYTAIGDTVNTAARLEHNAKKSQVLISQEVYASLKGRIKAESLGVVTMKGKGPVEVFSLLEVGG